MSGESLALMALRASSQITCVAGAGASPCSSASRPPQPSSNALR
jgi:hypothetical protein